MILISNDVFLRLLICLMLVSSFSSAFSTVNRHRRDFSRDLKKEIRKTEKLLIKLEYMPMITEQKNLLTALIARRRDLGIVERNFKKGKKNHIKRHQLKKYYFQVKDIQRSIKEILKDFNVNIDDTKCKAMVDKIISLIEDIDLQQIEVNKYPGDDEKEFYNKQVEIYNTLISDHNETIRNQSRERCYVKHVYEEKDFLDRKF